MDTAIGGLPVGLCMPWRKFPVIPASGTGEIGRSVGSMIVSLLLLVVLPGPGLVTVLQMCPPVTSLGRRPIAVYERTGEWGGRRLGSASYIQSSSATAPGNPGTAEHANGLRDSPAILSAGFSFVTNIEILAS